MAECAVCGVRSMVILWVVVAGDFWRGLFCFYHHPWRWEMTFGTAAQLGGTNVCAFLDAIAVSEIGAALLSKSDNGYNCLVGSTPMHPALFSDYSQHPDIFNKQCNSDAAGRYQIMHHWWLAY